MKSPNSPHSAIIRVSQTISPALQSAIQLWADSSTDATSSRRDDLRRDKIAALVGTRGKAQGFFALFSMSPQDVTPVDVKAWQKHLEAAGLSAASVYARISRLSSFYEWLMTEPTFREQIKLNPCTLSRPKAPKPYQSDKTKALTDEQARALLRVVKVEADAGDVAAKRDYALLRFFFATGKRREEIVRLQWGDVRLQRDGIVITAKHKGGIYSASEVRDVGVRAALIEYFKASGRWNEADQVPQLDENEPLWLRHDNAANGRAAVTSHGFAKAVKRYAERAGIADFHLHQTRHTVARMVGEESGNLSLIHI